MADKSTDKEHSEDLKILHGMGYAQELSRSMSKFSNFAISFSIICILSGGINSFAQAIASVGGAGAGMVDRGLRVVGDVRPVDGAGRFGFPDSGRAVSLGVHSGEPVLGLADSLA